MAEGILEGFGLSARFGGVLALDQVSISFSLGEVHAIVGANGAGKTTLLNVLTGAVTGFEGSVAYEGHPVTGHSLGALARLGVRRTFQTCQLVPTLTVQQNILLGIEGAGHKLSDDRDFVRVIRQLNLEPCLSLPISSATFSIQRRTEIARALVAKPRVVLFDEPSSGLDRTEGETLAALIGSFATEGLAIGLIDHDVEFIHGVADRLTVLELGSVLLSSPVADLKDGVRGISW